LEARGNSGRCAIAVTAAALVVAGCGGGPRQDANEKSGDYRLEVVDASFPAKQKLAKTSQLVIEVRNSGSTTAPDVGVTVNGLSTRRPNPDLADASRPTFVINGKDVKIGGVPDTKEDVPRGCDTAYVNTWACGPLRAGESRTFRFGVTAVSARPYKITYKVSAGLNGKARAVGDSLSGSFAGKVSGAAPATRVADDGHTIVNGSR
jgi:hypothetical protein